MNVWRVKPKKGGLNLGKLGGQAEILKSITIRKPDGWEGKLIVIHKI